MVHNTHYVLELLTRKNNRSLIVERKQYNTRILFLKIFKSRKKKIKKICIYVYIYIIYIYMGGEGNKTYQPYCEL